MTTIRKIWTEKKMLKRSRELKDWTWVMVSESRLRVLRQELSLKEKTSRDRLIDRM